MNPAHVLPQLPVVSTRTGGLMVEPTITLNNSGVLRRGPTSAPKGMSALPPLPGSQSVRAPPDTPRLMSSGGVSAMRSAQDGLEKEERHSHRMQSQFQTVAKRVLTSLHVLSPGRFGTTSGERTEDGGHPRDAEQTDAVYDLARHAGSPSSPSRARVGSNVPSPALSPRRRPLRLQTGGCPILGELSPAARSISFGSLAISCLNTPRSVAQEDDTCFHRAADAEPFGFGVAPFGVSSSKVLEGVWLDSKGERVEISSTATAGLSERHASRGELIENPECTATWSSGSQVVMTCKRNEVSFTDSSGQTFSAELQGGNLLTWNSGEVWTLQETAAREAVAQSQSVDIETAHVEFFYPDAIESPFSSEKDGQEADQIQPLVGRAVSEEMISKFIEDMFAEYASTKDGKKRPLMNNGALRSFFQDFVSVDPWQVIAEADMHYANEIERQKDICSHFDLTKAEAGRGLSFKSFVILLDRAMGGRGVARSTAKQHFEMYSGDVRSMRSHCGDD